MRAAITALTDELKRLKAAGVTSVPVSVESIAALRKALGAQIKAAAANAPIPLPKPSAGPATRASMPAELEQELAKPAASSVRRTEAIVPKAPPAPVPTLPPPPFVKLPEGDKATQWAWLRDFVLDYPVCKEKAGEGKKGVFGVGSLDAKIMFIGEAPEAEDEAAGEPFVGPSGQLLTKMIAAMGLKRENVYITYLVNWRMPATADTSHPKPRSATAEEMAFCTPFLKAQIEIIKPDLLVALGSTVAHGLLGSTAFKTLPEVRGQWKQFGSTPVTVTYHPSYLLRQELTGPGPAKKAKRATWEDLLKVMERANLPISDKQRGYFL